MEPISPDESTGRAVGLLLAYLMPRIAKGEPPTLDQIGEFAEQCVYDDARIRPEIKQFFQGVAEALSVAAYGGPDATL
jgi:hypothetical protein